MVNGFLVFAIENSFERPHVLVTHDATEILLGRQHGGNMPNAPRCSGVARADREKRGSDSKSAAVLEQEQAPEEECRWVVVRLRPTPRWEERFPRASGAISRFPTAPFGP